MGDPSSQIPHEHGGLRDRDRLQETSYATHNMLSLLVRQQSFTGTPEVCAGLIQSCEALLLPEWVRRGLPLNQLWYGVATPGATPFTSVLALQEQDQAGAMVAELGGEALVVVLTDDPQRVGVPTKSVQFS